MALPLFNLFDSPDQTPLYDALRGVGPQQAWRIMQRLHEADLPRYERESPGYERSDATADLARRNFALAPALTTVDTETAAERFGQYGPRLQFESTFVTMWLHDRDTLFDAVVDTQGGHHLSRALADGGVLVLPLHLGPSYVIPPLLAHHAPTRLVFNRMAFAELRAAAFPELDIDAVAIDEGRTFATGLRTLRDGGIFAMFPELDPRGQGLRHRPVPFLGTRALAPEGPMVLAQAARCPVVPAVLDSHGDGRFTLRFDAPIVVDRGDDALATALADLWSIIEGHVLQRLGDWEMWVEFDRMVDEVVR